MKRKILIGVCGVLLSGVIGALWASDHGDTPAVTGKSTDIADLYAFESPANANNMVFISNVQGPLSPAASAGAAFDPKTLIEFNLDNTGDNIEDLVIQCVPHGNKMYVYGPLKPHQPGLTSTIQNDASVVTEITRYGSKPLVGKSRSGITAFAGPRDDPFFFDVGQYIKIIKGEAKEFSATGADGLAGTNVLSVVVEVPKAMLGSADKINVWLETKQSK